MILLLPGNRGILIEEKLFSYNPAISTLIYKIKGLTENFRENTVSY